MRLKTLAASLFALTVAILTSARSEPLVQFTLPAIGPDGKPVWIAEISKTSIDPPIPPHERAPLSADAATLVTGNNRFALNIYHHLAAGAKPNENVLVSPFSISTALAMTYAGARGNTASQMADVLGFSLADDRLHPAFGELIRDLSVDREGYQLSVANRLFGKDGFSFKQTFLDTTSRDYAAPLKPLNFIGDPDGSRKHINDWVAQRTNDRIQNLMPEGSVNEDTRLVLANAIYFDGSWKSKFEKNRTRKETFYGTSGREAQVDMMFQNQTFRYAEQSNFQMLEMPYAGDDLSMVVLLPTERDGLAELEGSITPDALDAALEDLYSTEVNVYLPKFTFNSAFKLGAALEDLGMTDAFDPIRANFSGIADEELSIQTAVHKAFIDVNEEGTEAAAATGIGLGITSCLCGPPQPKTFRADHPFLFALRDRHSGSLLFLGRVMQPGEWAANAALGPAVPEPATMALFLIASACLAARRSRA